MKALVYLLKTSMINYFKRIKEKPQKALGIIFGLIWVAIILLPRNKSSNGELPLTVVISILVVLTMVTVLFSLYSGTKKVKSKFNMSDVNLIFVSPIKPQTVMVYGIVKKIALEFFTSMYVLFQITNSMKNLNITVLAKILFIIVYIIFQLILCNILKLFIFAVCSRYKKVGNIIRNFIKAFSIVVIVLIAFIIVKGDIKNSFIKVGDTITYSLFFKYIPIFGWMREIAVQTITGVKVSYYIYIILILLLSAILLYITYNIKLDFYEDMLNSAEINEDIKDIKSGKVPSNKRKKGLMIKPFKNIGLDLKEIYGSKVLLFKHMNEYSKRSFIFFINTYSVILLLISVILGIFAKSTDIKIVFIMSAGLLFFSSGFGGKIYNEISHYFIFLLPDSPQKKIFYGIASSLIKMISDAAILFIPFGILSRKSIFEILLCIICYVVLGGMLSYSGLFAFRIAHMLGFTEQMAKGIIFMLFQLILVVPIAIIVLIFIFLLKDFSGYAIYLAFLIYGIGAATLISLGCDGIFNDMEID
ncbi:putative ABC exporter domain-containing protein [Clostridium arbusti]|uniref:putative ABC exporter domain-containing protein n=1 Tax=Clostridium arbusti TaxID=1137848 RepID=UPI00028917FD|nr:putative ABC exporter domain-containing protein [Clostridium arbusti]